MKALADLGRKELAKMKKDLEDKLYAPDIKTPRPAADLPEAIGQVFPALGRSLTRLDETLADPKFITRDKAELALAVPMPKELLTVGGRRRRRCMPRRWSRPSAEGRKRGRRPGALSSSNNLKQIGIAIHSYHDANGAALPQDILDKNGKPLLSCWRESRSCRTWNRATFTRAVRSSTSRGTASTTSRSRRALIKTYMSPNAKLPEKPEYGMTSYRAISGPGAAFEPGKKIRLVDFTDGTSNTIMVIESEEWVPWAKPGDYPFDPKKPLPKIVPAGGQKVFQALLGDGSVRAIRADIPEKTLKAAFTRNGGEIFDFDK